MRTISLVAAAAIALVLSMGAFAAEEEPRKATHESIETKVLKVFAAKDGNAIFRAYLIKWKDQEVIASDQLAKSNYQVGDTIEVLAMNHPFPKRKEGPGLLHFQVSVTAVPEKREVPPPASPKR